jgi:hypothetical protein
MQNSANEKRKKHRPVISKASFKRINEKKLTKQIILFKTRTMKNFPSAQTQGFFDVELRVQWLEAKGNPLTRLDAVTDERILPALQFNFRQARQ